MQLNLMAGPGDMPGDETQEMASELGSDAEGQKRSCQKTAVSVTRRTVGRVKLDPCG